MVKKHRWAILTISVIFGIAAASMIGSQTYPIGPLGVQVSWSWSRLGETHLVFPPLGEVHARTHLTPVRLNASLMSIDLSRLKDFVESPGRLEDLSHTIIHMSRGAALSFVSRLIAIAAVSSGMVAWLLTSQAQRASLTQRASFSMMWKGAGSAALLIGLMSVLTSLTFRVDAFKSPTYRGALSSAPWLIEAVQEGIAKSAVLEERLATLSVNIYQMYEQVERLVPPLAIAEADVVLLHVTDFHNHPAAARVTLEFASAFDVDFIINTGDLTEYGTFLEAEIVDKIRETPVPYYFVSGNHETPELLERISLMPELTLLDGREVTQAGVRILGIGDPGAQSPLAHAMSIAQAREIADQLNQSLSAMAAPPDIVAVHNFRVAESIRPGLVPLVVYGHSHTPSVFFRGGTAYVNAGTTGGAGIRGIEAPEPVRISLAVIYLKTDTGLSQVIGVDLIRLSPVAAGFVMERYLVPTA